VRRSHQSKSDLVLRTRLSVVTAVISAAGALMTAGVPPVEAAAAVVAGALGGAGVGCRLTAPHVAPNTVVSVLVAVLVVIVSVVRLGYPVGECLAVVLASAWCAAEIAKRITATIHRPGRAAAI